MVLAASVHHRVIGTDLLAEGACFGRSAVGDLALRRPGRSDERVPGQMRTASASSPGDTLGEIGGRRRGGRRPATELRSRGPAARTPPKPQRRGTTALTAESDPPDGVDAVAAVDGARPHRFRIAILP